MYFISHRGNLDGINKNKENSIDYIVNCIEKGYDVEIDIWKINDLYYLGHDEPVYNVDLNFFGNYRSKLWIHCKNLESLYDLKNCEYNYFWHQNDDFTLTSKNYIWTYPGKVLTNYSICVLPEISNYTKDDLYKCAGICSDNIEYYRNLIQH